FVCRAHKVHHADHRARCHEGRIDADVVECTFVENLTSFLGDVEAWRDRLGQSKQVERDRLAKAVERAENDREKVERTIEPLQDAYATKLAEGDREGAEIATEVLKRKRAELQHADTRLQAYRDALEAVGDEVEVDPMLDFYSQVSG